MTQEEKELLLQDLCARLPYGIKCSIPCEPQIATIQTIDTIYLAGCVVVDYSNSIDSHFLLKDIKPYLRPMSSMTEEENNEWRDSWFGDLLEATSVVYPKSEEFLASSHSKSIDWLNKKMFDYRGLIPKNLALSALEGMYNIND